MYNVRIPVDPIHGMNALFMGEGPGAVCLLLGFDHLWMHSAIGIQVMWVLCCLRSPENTSFTVLRGFAAAHFYGRG